jgi:small GTP-binding protein
MRRPRILAAAAILIAVIALLSVLVVAPGADRTWSGYLLRGLSLAAGFFLMLVLVVAIPLAVRTIARAICERRLRRDEFPPAVIPEDLVRAADAQARRAGEFITRVCDPSRREELALELSVLQAESQQEKGTLRVVVFGTGSSGKTSLINALLGQKVGETEAVIGTTQHGDNHTYELGGVEGTVYLTDTPGLAEAGPGGEVREIEARSLAVRADLLLFVVDHDLLRGEYERLIELARLGKRSIVVLNKKDRFPDRDLAAIAAKLRERLSGVIDADDIVTVAAAPRPIPVQVRRADGTTETVLEVEQPDIAALRTRIGQVLAREGKLLRVANLLVRGRVLEREAHNQLEREREQRAEAVVEHYQWVAAGTVFANPMPALDILAGGAVQLEMIGELARVHGVELSVGQVRALAAMMLQAILKLGLIEAATSLIAGVFKRTLIGFAAGGAVQAVTMAYLTRVSGRAFIDYFRAGESWGPDGTDAVVLRQFELNNRTEFLQVFVNKVVNEVLEKMMIKASQNAKGGR